MRFYMPTRVYSENDCVSKHSRELASLGSRALIVTGRSSSAKNGSLGDVNAALEKHGVEYVVFSDIEENPSVETVMRAREVGLGFGADFVIGIGGGSPLDAAKAAALMLGSPDKEWEYMYEAAPTLALPVAAVPTTCGTGSEVTGVSVITRHDLKTKVSLKHRIFPKLALIDGKYLLSAPRTVIVNTAVDALAHLIESGANTLADSFSDMIVLKGLDSWRLCRPYIEGRLPIDEAAAQLLMETAAYAGMAIAQNGTSIPHALSYMLTYEAGIPHGPAVGAFQANYLRYSPAAMQDKLLAAAGFTSTDELGELIKALAPISADRDLLERSAQSVLAKPDKLALCPYELDEGLISEIINI